MEVVGGVQGQSIWWAISEAKHPEVGQCLLSNKQF